MAKQGAKGQKIGRMKTRSPAHKRYNFGERWKVNKIRKLQRHVKHHTEDKPAASALHTIIGGGTGPVPTFKPIPYTPSGKVDSRDVDVEYRKHHTVNKRSGGRNQRIVILEEQAASQPVYVVMGHGLCELERTIILSDALKAFDRSTGEATLIERKGSKCAVLKNKRAVPIRGTELKYRTVTNALH